MTTPPAPTPAPATAGTTAPATGAAARLRNGELRAMVARVLADNHGTPLTPRAIAAKLGGRSSGAVGNALKALADQGHAFTASAAPLTYGATATTDTVAAATITPAPPRRPGTTRAARPNRTTTAPAPALAPAATAPTPAPAPVTGPVTRPNGTPYHPRLLSGMPDVVALRKLRDAGIPALMYGPPGTGKTSVVEAAFPDLLTVQGDGDTTVADLVGEYAQTVDENGTVRYTFIHGPLVRAMREGRTLFIDDATLIPPTVLAVVYPPWTAAAKSSSKPTAVKSSTPRPGSMWSPGTTPACTARCSPTPCHPDSPPRSTCPPTTTSPRSSRSTSAR